MSGPPGPTPAPETGETDPFQGLTAPEDRQQRLADLFTAHRDRLRVMVDLRLDPRLQARIDSSDVLQEVFLEASQRLPEYTRDTPMPLFLWLRKLAGQKLHDLHRFHLGAQARDARREVHSPAAHAPEASTANLSAHVVARQETASKAAMREETRLEVQKALDSLDPLDREVLALRHFECLSNVEVARVLDLQESAASKRYIRALERLRACLGK